MIGARLYYSPGSKRIGTALLEYMSTTLQGRIRRQTIQSTESSSAL
jgi:hypothetical protein